MAAHQLSCRRVPGSSPRGARAARRVWTAPHANGKQTGYGAAQLSPGGWGARGNKKQDVWSAPRGAGPVSTCRAAHPGEAAERAEPQPLEPRCVGTAQLTSEACAASKPVPEGNVSHQQLVSAAPGSC